MMDEATTFELKLLAYSLQLVLLRRGSSTNYYRAICNQLWQLEKRNGISISWYISRTGADDYALMQLLDRLASEERIILSGTAQSKYVRLAPTREIELLQMIDFPHLDETLEALRVIQDTRCKGVGNRWQVVDDHLDTGKANGLVDRIHDTTHAWKCFALARLRGWVDIQTNARGYAFVRITEAGRALLKNPPKRTPVDLDDLTNTVFWNSMRKAADDWKASSETDEKDFNEIPLPVGLDYPDATVARMLPVGTKRRIIGLKNQTTTLFRFIAPF